MIVLGFDGIGKDVMHNQHEVFEFSTGIQIPRAIFGSRKEEIVYFKKLAAERQRYYEVLFKSQKVIDYCLRLYYTKSYSRLLNRNGITNNEKSERNDLMFKQNAATITELLKSSNPRKFKKIAKLLIELPWTHDIIVKFHSIYLSEPDHKNALLTRFSRFNTIRQACITNNMRLVALLAGKLYVSYRCREKRIIVDDLIEEGIFGLMRAVDQFDASRGLRFSTFATNWIKQKVVRFIEEDREVKIPIYLLRCIAYISKSDNAQKTDAQIAKQCRINKSAVKNARACYNSNAMSNLVSLSKSYLNDGGGEISNNTAVDYRETADEEVLRTNDHSYLVDKIRHILLPRELDIITRRFLLPKTQTLKEIGAALHLTRERIRQIESVALDRLRHSRVILDYNVA